VTRRQAEKLQPLLDEIRAAGGRPMALARMRARKKKWPN
jgi:hypothetical protein